MEQKIPSRLEKLRPSNLHLDQLEKIIDLLASLNSNVFIETGTYKYSSLEELVHNNEELIYELYLSCGKYSSMPECKVSFTNSGTEIYIPTDDVRSRGVFEKIKEIILNKEMYYRRLIIQPRLYLVIIAQTFVILTIGGFFKNFGALTLAMILLVESILYFVVLWKISEKLSIHSLINLVHEKNKGSFWKRKKDDLFLIIISNLLTALLSGALGYYLGK